MALEDLKNAKNLLEEGNYRLSLNRSYYSIFHAIRAICAYDGFDSSKHSGLIAYFNKNYVKPGIFPRETSKLISGAYKMREKSDYEDFYIASREDAENQAKNTEIFYLQAKEYLSQKF